MYNESDTLTSRHRITLEGWDAVKINESRNQITLKIIYFKNHYFKL